MKSVIALRHLHFEDLGSLEPLFVALGYQVHYVDASVADFASLDVTEPDLLVVLGGPVGAFDEGIYPFLAGELALVERRLHSQRPMLGICLGAQLIARVLGARVYPMGYKEIGFSPLTLTPQGLDSQLAALRGTPVLHWHGDQFDIPPGAIHLAGSSACPNQAFAYGHNVLALQFHLEANSARIEQWLVGHACELGQAGIDPRIVRQDAQDRGQNLTRAAHEVIGTWLKQIE
jgi:GMP synthase (glutamine-hydrolysing)